MLQGWWSEASCHPCSLPLLPLEGPSCWLSLNNFLRRDLSSLAVADPRMTQRQSGGSTGPVLPFGFFLEGWPKMGVGRGVV